MIAKQDILDRVSEWHLRPDVIEKDYVLGWVLAALSAHPQAGAHWVFKGGTCLRRHKTSFGNPCSGRRGHLVRVG
jgi:predicted nucleotidyltransferase component of viral defense system